ncbi:hypothetical protein D3C78_1466760 [compost metagenome]
MLQRRLVVGQLLQQLGADGQAVAAGERLDLAEVAEARAHHHGPVAVGLVVAVDARDGLHARVFATGEVAAFGFLVPVVDAPDEGGDQEHPGIGAGSCLGEVEQ